MKDEGRLDAGFFIGIPVKRASNALTDRMQSSRV